MKASTGLRNYMLDTGAMKTGLNSGFLKIYSGTPPVTADDAIGSAGTNNLLVTITESGDGVTGLTFAATASAGTIVKNASETWQGTIALSGTATFGRFVTASDTGASSTTERRLQLTIATSGSDLNMTDTTLTSGGVQPINAFSVAFPTS